VASFVDWYNLRQRHSGIKFVTPHQRYSAQAVEICRLRVGSPRKPTPLVTINTLLALFGSGLDQPTSNRTSLQSSYVDDGCLNRSSCINFPGSHRLCNASRWGSGADSVLRAPKPTTAGSRSLGNYTNTWEAAVIQQPDQVELIHYLLRTAADLLE